MTEYYLMHHGIKGQRWGVRNGPPYPLGSSPRKVFISGTSKIKLEDSGYYRDKLPKEVTDRVDNYIKNNYHILIGDAPGIDTEIQKYLAKKGHKNVTVYTIGDTPRFYSDTDGELGWGVKKVKGSEQVDKDKAMSSDAHMGFAVTLERGSSATRNNIERLRKDNKDVEEVQLNADGSNAVIYNLDVNRVNNIYNSLPYLERFYVNPQGANSKDKRLDIYANKRNYGRNSTNVYSHLTEIDNMPISVFDIWLAPDNTAEVSLMTRGGKQYRNRGYASREARQAVEWLNNHPEIDQVIWGVYKDNIGSQRVAQNAGFKRWIPPGVTEEDWQTYLLYPVRDL